MEVQILSKLEFNVTTPSQWRFLERFAQLLRADSTTLCLSRYLLELALVDYRMLKFTPSLIAAGSIYLSVKILRR